MWRIGFYKPGFHHTDQLLAKNIKIVGYQSDTHPGDLEKYPIRLYDVDIVGQYVTLDELISAHFEILI